MSFLKGLKKIESKPIVKQTPIIVKQTPTIVKQDEIKLNPDVKTIEDIPNTNIMTSGILLGISLRAKRKKMLEELKNYISELLKNDL